MQHLHRYLSEFQFKQNHRKAQDVFVLVIMALVIAFSLPYEALIERRRARRTTGRKIVH